MKSKTVGQRWKLRNGLLYAGMIGVSAVLVSPDSAMIFDSRDNPELKAKFYGLILNCKFEVELCES